MSREADFRESLKNNPQGNQKDIDKLKEEEKRKAFYKGRSIGIKRGTLKGRAQGILGTVAATTATILIAQGISGEVKKINDPYGEIPISATAIGIKEDYVKEIKRLHNKLSVYPGKKEVEGLTSELCDLSLIIVKEKILEGTDINTNDISNIRINAEEGGNNIEVNGNKIYTYGQLDDVIGEISNMERIRYNVFSGNREYYEEYKLWELEKDFTEMMDYVAAGEVEKNKDGNITIRFKTINEWEKEQKEKNELER